MMVRRELRNAPYIETLAKMKEFTEQRSQDTPDELWLVEHLPVLTLGQAGRENHLLNPGEIPVVRTERGGQVTYHGPGQVVVYTLIDIRRLGVHVKDTVCKLEQALIDTLTHLVFKAPLESLRHPASICRFQQAIWRRLPPLA
jgi:lipoyl(octanoyl) transferase